MVIDQELFDRSLRVSFPEISFFVEDSIIVRFVLYPGGGIGCHYGPAVWFWLAEP